MKKILITLSALTVAATLTFTGCNLSSVSNSNKEDKTKNEAKENKVPEELKPIVDDLRKQLDEYVPEAEKVTPVYSEPAEAAPYIAALEARLEEIESKGELDSENILTVNGLPVSAASARYAVIASNYYHKDSTEENKQEIIDKEITEFYALNAAVVELAAKEGITVTDEEFETNFKAMKDQLVSYYGDDYANVIDEYANQTPYYYFLNQMYNYLYSKVYEKYTADPESDFVKEITDKVIADMKEADMVRAKHILVCFPEGEEVTDEVKKKALDKANAIKALIDEGEDFDKLIKVFGEDPGMSANPDGYYFGKGEMVAPFEETTYALKEGEVSEPVETSYGYHIILKLPLEYSDSLPNNEKFQNAGYTKLREMLTADSADYEIIYNSNYDAKEAEFIAEYEEIVAKEAAAAAQQEEAQNNAEQADE